MTLQMYGFFRGGDPRKFKPDMDASPAELARWREDCARWERGLNEEPPERTGLAARNPYGMGRYVVETEL